MKTLSRSYFRGGDGCTSFLSCLLILVLVALLRGVSARVGSSPWAGERKSNHQRSLAELSSQVNHELNFMVKNKVHGAGGLSPIIMAPYAAKRVHKLLLEGSANDGKEVDSASREMAMEALRSAVSMAKSDGRKGSSKDLGILQKSQSFNATDVKFSDKRMNGRSLQDDEEFDVLELFGLRETMDKMQSFFDDLLFNLVEMAVGSVYAGSTVELIVGAWQTGEIVTGQSKSDLEDVVPCSDIPLSNKEGDTFGYLSIFNQTVQVEGQDLTQIFDQVLAYFKVDEYVEDVLGFVDEWIAPNSESEPELVKELPFCMLWGESNSGLIDTLAFRPKDPWPPVVISDDPLKGSLLPLCITGTCSLCEFANGLLLGVITIQGVPTVAITTKFTGVGVSFGLPGKLAFENKDGFDIWDGFRNVEIPDISGMNFWLGFELNVIPYPSHQLALAACQSSTGLSPEMSPLTGLFLKLSFELYVAINRSDASGNQREEEKNAAEGAITNVIGGGISGTSNNQEEEWLEWDPCVLMTAKAEIIIPFIGSTIVLGKAVGGFCTFPPDEISNTRCTPSGYFLNMEMGFEVQDGLLGLLSSFVEGWTGVGFDDQKEGNSFGIFQDPDGYTESVVFRFETPDISIFGIPLSPPTSTPKPKPKVHLQWAKGSEIERRRETILRTRKKVSGEWLGWQQNCIIEEYCSDSEENWADFGEQTDSVETQICRNILINPDENSDKLMYYNRVIIAELKDPEKLSDNYLLIPPVNSVFQAPPRYDFSQDLSADVLIAYLKFDINWFIMEGIIIIKEVSMTMILSISEGIEPTISEPEYTEAMTLYKDMDEKAKLFWRRPSGWHFPSLEEYKNHLPTDSTNPTSSEINDALDWNAIIDSAQSDHLSAYIHFYGKISVLFFADISVGFSMNNFVDGDPNHWEVAGAFDASVLGMVYSVAVTTTINFDRRRHLHLEGDERHLILSESGLLNSAWDAIVNIKCEVCDDVVEFFEDVGEAIWNGLTTIGELFGIDMAAIGQKALDTIGEWGEKFMGTMQSFVDGIEGALTNGEVGKLMTEGSTKVFADDVINLWDKLSVASLDTVLDIAASALQLVGNCIENACWNDAWDFVVAGYNDISAYITSFFGDIFTDIINAIGCGVFGNCSWDEMRLKKSYESPNACDCNPDEAKTTCWCKDEYECRVKIYQQRSCERSWWQDSCGSWKDVPIKRTVNGKLAYPRYDGRVFDEACRKERMAELGKVKRSHDKMKKMGNMVDSNLESKKGLSDLKGASLVETIEFENIAAIKDGSVLDNVSAQGTYKGSQLIPSSTDMSNVEKVFSAPLNFSQYANVTELEGDIDTSTIDRSLKSSDTSTIDRSLKRSAANVFLEKQDFSDTEFFDKDPIYPPPALELKSGSIGTSDNPVQVECSGTLATAWAQKLASFEPEVMRRRRSRRLGHAASSLNTVIEYPVEARIMQMILDGYIQIETSVASSFGGDALKVARDLLGTEGVGSFMDRSNSRRRKLALSDYEWEIDVESVEPLCDKLEWAFSVTATDSTGTSNAIIIHAFVEYGEIKVDDVPAIIQTRCDSDLYGADDLDDNPFLKLSNNVTTFKPSFKADNCPSPYVHMSLTAVNDVIKNQGTSCSTDYKVVERSWDLDVHVSDEHLTCPSPSTNDFPFKQTIILGGLVDENGKPASPIFELQPATFHVPNTYEAGVATKASDFFANNIPPASECGICAISYSHPEDFVGADIGDNIVNIKVLNNIGIELNKATTATVKRGCPEDYNEIAQYESGDAVTGPNNYVYACRPWPEGGHCNNSALSPFTQHSWMGWYKLEGQCEGTHTPTTSPTFSGDPISGCPGEFDSTSSYEAGDVVAVNSVVYECKAWPIGLYCNNAGYKPGLGAFEVAWNVLGWCEGSLSPSVSTVSAIGIPGCPPLYNSSYLYAAGDEVLNKGKVYKCKPYPFYMWCHTIAPGTGLSSQAWSEVGDCNEAMSASVETSNSGILDPNGDRTEEIEVNAQIVQLEEAIREKDAIIDALKEKIEELESELLLETIGEGEI